MLGGVEESLSPSDIVLVPTGNPSNWIYSNDYGYFTQSQYEDSVCLMWEVLDNGGLYQNAVWSRNQAIRPVIVLSKSVL